MPNLLWLDIASLSASLVIAAALVITVLGARTRRTLNYTFIALTLVEGMWATMALLLRFSLLLDIGNPSLLLELSALALAITAPLILMFTARYLDRPTRWLDMLVAGGAAGMALLSIPLFRHHLILPPRLAPNGAILYDLSPWGIAATLLPATYMVLALVLFWQERFHIQAPGLASSVFIMLVGFISRNIPGIPSWVTTTLNPVGLLLIGYTVISQQIFNPLKELTEELEQRVENRTRELTRVAAQLTTIHSLGQKLVLSRNEVEITQLVLDAARAMLHISSCDVWMVNREEKVVTRQTPTEHTASPPTSISLNDPDSIVASVVRDGQPVHLLVTTQETDDEGEPRVGFELCVPLQVGTHVIGALKARRDTGVKFSSADQQLLEALANSAAIAIRNARLYAEIRHRTERLAVVNHIAKVVGATLDVDDLMACVYLEIVAAFHPDAFFIALYDDQTNELDFCFQVDEGIQHPPNRYPLGIGLTSLVVTEKQPLIIRDVAKRQKEGDLPPSVLFGTDKKAATWLGVPMLIDDRVLGVISVQSYQACMWDEKDELLLLTIADQVALALEKARLLQERERRVTELAIVNEIGRAVSSTLEMDRVLKTVHRQVSRLFDTTNFFIATYEEATQEWAIAFYIEQDQAQPTGQRYPLEYGFTGHIIRNRQHLLFRTGKEILAFHEEHGIETVGPTARSWLGVPLVTADRIVGVMGIQNYEQENLYTEQDLALLSTVAAQIAPALYNLRLLEETRRRAKELEVINRVSQTITSMMDLDTVLLQIVDTIKTRFGHYFVNIALVEGEELVFQSGSAVGETRERIRFHKTRIPLILKPSLVAETARTGQPVLSQDTLDDPRYLPIPELPDTRCELGVPLKAKGQVIGVLDVQSDRPFTYDQADISLLQALANQAGVIIENARLLEETRRRAEELAVLNELGQALTTRLNVEDVLDAAYREASRLVDTTNFYIGLYDPEKNKIHFALDVSESQQDSDITLIPADQGFAGYIVQNRTSVLIQDDLFEWQREAGIISVGEPARCFLGVPLIIGNVVLGVMAVQSYTTPYLYTEHDRDLLTAIGSQVAIALQNAYLFEETEAALIETGTLAKELATLNELAQALTAQLDMDQVLTEAYRGASQLLDVSNFSIGLYDPDTEKIIFPLTFNNSTVDRQLDVIPVGQGLNGYVIQHRTSLLIRENLIERMEQLGIELLGEPARSWLGVPLVIGDRVLGSMSVQSFETAGAYTERDRDLLTAVASQTAIAIQNARLYEQAQHDLAERKRAEEEAQRRAAQAALIYEVGQRVSGELELDALLTEIVTSVREAFDYYGVLLMLREENSDRLVLQSTAGGYVDTFSKELWLSIGSGMTGQAAVTGDTQLSGDVDQNPHYIRVADEQTQSELAVPIKSGSQIIGVLDLQSDELDAFDKTDVMLMETLADQIGTAIQNARLYKETQQRLREQEMLFNASQSLVSAPLQVEEIAEIAVRQLSEVMETTACSFSLFDAQTGVLQVLADLWYETENGKEQLQQGEESFPLSDYPVAAHAMKTLTPLIVQANDPTADEAELAYMQKNDTATLVVIPVTIKGEAIGVLEIETKMERHYTPQQLNMAITLANQVAVAVENARLYQAVQQELTERQQAEEQLQRYATELERSNEEVKQFAYIVSHDLRAPLVNMKGFASELRLALDDIHAVLDTITPQLDPDQRQTLTYALNEDAPEALDFIESSVTHMDRFISALLKLSRLGRQDLKLEPVDMTQLVQATMETLAHQVTEHQCRVTVEPLPQVVADRTSMEQIVGNILGNAVKYLAPDRAGEIKVTAEQSDDEITIHIHDNGRGIAAQDMDKVFAPFRRAGRQDVPGEGMGLAYVQALVRRHGGRIWCQSEPDVGTTFSFTIPNPAPGEKEPT